MITIRRHAKSAVQLALILAVAGSMAACQSRPKPQGPVTPGPGPAAPDSGPTSPGGPGGVTSGVIPGSQADFAQSAGGDRVFFDLDQYSIRSDAAQTLDAQAQWLSRYPGKQIRVEGNADERGTREYNLALGARRASAVREYLSSQGVSASRMSTVSYGKDRPIAGGADEESHQQNRNAHTALLN